MNLPGLEPTLLPESEKQRKRSSKRYRDFKKRTCNRFVRVKPNSEKCFCGLLKVEHSQQAQSNHLNNEVTWKAKNDTLLEPTDAYGQLEFFGSSQISRAKYIRIAHDTDASEVLDLMTTKWKLTLPKLLISVTGGAKEFVLHPKLKQILRQGLLKAARTTGAWIFTGGTNTGVMKHVGEAVRGHTVTSEWLLDDQLNLIGIATWGIVKDRDKLRMNEKGTVTYRMTSSVTAGKACLDNNHTHFILVDDGTNGKYGKEIAFRATLENVISKKKITEDKSYGIPVVLLVLEGGPNTIQTVLESVTMSPAVPVVIAKGSGRAADILAFAHRIVLENDGIEITEFQDDGEHPDLVKKIRQAFPECKQEKKVFDIYRNVLKCVGQKRYITIFCVDEEGVDIDRAILRALLKAQHASPADQLSLALVWNRVDIAKSEIFVDNKKWKIEELETAMLDALSNNRVEFVRLLQKNRVSIEYFLTKDRLLHLYEKRYKVSASLRQLLRREKLKSGFTLDYYEHINKIVNGMLGGIRTENLNIKSGLMRGTILSLAADDSIYLFVNPYDELFLWAVLCNMQEMALFMWERGDNNLARALIGARIYMAMARKMENENLRNDVYEDVIAHAQEFKDIALALLDECYRANEHDAQKLLTYHLKDWCGHSCLSLAVSLNHEEFVAHAACQSLISEIWMRTLNNNTPMWKILLGIFVPPTILFLEFKTRSELSLSPVTLKVEESGQDVQSEEDLDSYSEESEEDILSDFNKTRTTCLRGNNVPLRSIKYTKAVSTNKQSNGYQERRIPFWKKIYEFHSAPIIKFWVNVVAYMVFLMLFSYVILVEEGERAYYWEVLLIVFVVSLGVEELRQIIQSDASASDNRLKAWASSKWNICDGIALLLFFVGMGLRFHSSTAHIGHVVYSVDIILWIIRLLDIFTVSKNLGPYVVMIGRMTVEMLYFLIIMMVFLLAYGVAQHALLFPKQKGTWSLVPMILFRPYFQTYGELFITDPLHLDDTSTEFSTPKQNEYGGRITTVILALYLLVANILLLNLLIAIFNHIFSEVRNHSNQIWKFHRYWLIVEYAQRPSLAVPPFNILYQTYTLVRCLCKRICVPHRQQQRTTNNERRTENRLNKELEELMIFEEYRLYCYLHKKKTNFNASSEERVRVISDRVESMNTQLEEMAKNVHSKPSPPETKQCKKTRDEYDKAGHVSSRRSPYPMSNVGRFPLTDDQVKWKERVPGYNPPRYTADTLIRGTPSASADPEIQSESCDDVWLSFNDFDGNINRQSYVGIYDVIHGVPRNPMGRTGLTGRGLLQRWGPNHVDHHVITRWRKTTDDAGAEKHGNKDRELEFIAEKSRDSRWKIPENTGTVDKTFSTAFKEEFCESVSSSSSDKTKREQKRQLEKFFLESGIKVFRGYFDDERNTDNAWVETMVTNYHDETGEILGSVDFVDKGGADCRTWLAVSRPLNLPDSEVEILKKVAKLHKWL